MRKQPPTGKEVVARAKKAHFLKGRAARVTRNGADLEIVPAKLTGIRSVEDLEEGHVVAVVRRTDPGGAKRGAPREHNVFLAKVGDAWKVYTESGGEITEQKRAPELTYHKWGEQKVGRVRPLDRGDERAERGIMIPIVCWNFCLLSFWIWCLLSVTICIWIEIG